MTVLQQLYSLIKGAFPPATPLPGQLAVQAHPDDQRLLVGVQSAAGPFVWKDVGGNMTWAGAFTTPGTLYAKGDVVTDQGWLMIANAITSDRPAPAFVGQRVWFTGLPETPAWTGFTDPAPRVAVGIKHTVQTPGLMRSLRYWTVAGQFYKPFSQITKAGQPAPGISYGTEVLAGQTGWQTNAVPGVLVSPGDVVELGVEIRAAGSTSIQDSGNWNYSQANGNAALGEIRHAVSGGGVNMSIANVDLGSVNHATFLATLTTGDTFRAGGRTWTIGTVSSYANGINVTVTPTSRIPNGDYLFEFASAVVGVLIDYQEIPAGWGASLTTQGFFSTTGFANAVFSNNQFGMDASVQAISASSEWDVLSFPTILT